MKIDLQNPERFIKPSARTPGPYGLYILAGAFLLGLIIAACA